MATSPQENDARRALYIEAAIATPERWLDAFCDGQIFGGAQDVRVRAHRQLIDKLRAAGSPSRALQDDGFVLNLYILLRLWRADRPGGLCPVEELEARLRAIEEELDALSTLSLDDPDLDPGALARRIWRLIEEVRVKKGASQLVAGTKCLHHLLPDLVVPVDGAYTRPFLWLRGGEQWSAVKQPRVFEKSFATFAQVAREGHVRRYLGYRDHPMMSGIGKLVDNVICGLVDGLGITNQLGPSAVGPAPSLEEIRIRLA
jgi:hypothetical protein